MQDVRKCPILKTDDFLVNRTSPERLKQNEKTTPAPKNVSRMQQAVRLEKEMGKELGNGSVL